MINRNGHTNFGHRSQIQRGLFDPPPIIVTDPGPALKSAMRDADRAAQKKLSMSRDNIVDAMNELADRAAITCNGNARRVTVNIYNKWLSASEKHNIPLRLLPIFCMAVKSNRPLEVYATFFDSIRVISVDDIKKLEWAEVEITKRQLNKQSKKLASEVGL